MDTNTKPVFKPLTESIDVQIEAEKPTIVLKPGENPGLTNTEYHSEKAHLSSSNLKDLLTDPQKFYEEKILGKKRATSDQPQLVIGSLTHSLVLEPETVEKEYAFFDGWKKQGILYQKCKEENPNKEIISKPQRNVAERLARAVTASKTAKSLFANGVPELSLASRILNVPVKCRADYLNVPAGYIADLKTTSQISDVDAFKQTMEQYRYDLSAALYCQIAHDVYGKVFDFYFVVVSKADMGCMVYKASSATLSKGASDMIKSLVLYKKCKEAGTWDLTVLNKPATLLSEEILEV